MNEQKLVSIIMPAYNCEKYIEESINSVIYQTYDNWELIIVDDQSTDNTVKVITSLMKNEGRIVLASLKVNAGAAKARNKGIALSKGEYIAFLDSDDLWKKEKLEKQITFMEKNNYVFTATSYSKVDEESCETGKKVDAYIIQNYTSLLKYPPGNSTIIYNCKLLGKFYVSDIKKRNDYLMWLGLIKKAEFIHGLDEILASHRLRKDSLSYKKADLVKYHWTVYRKHEKLSFLYSCYLIQFWIFKTLYNRLKK